MAKKWYKRASCKQQTRKQKKRAEEQARWARLHAEMEAAGYTENTMKRIGEVKNMKLNIQNIIWIGDPEIDGELEIATYGRIFDVEIVKERMSFQGMDFGVRPAVVKATTTSADDYKSWEILGDIGVDTGMAGIWDNDAPEGSTWSEADGIYVSNYNDETVDGVIMTSGLGDGTYNVYVKRNENGEITDFVIDFRD